MSSARGEPPPGLPTDAELVRRSLEEPDARAFGQLAQRHQAPLRAWLRRLLEADAAWADDLAQETLLRAFRSRSQWRGDASFRSWLLRIAVHVCRDHQRAPSVWTVSADGTDALWDERTEGPSHAPDASLNPPGPGREDDLAALVAQRLDIDRALQRLSPAQRAVIVHVCWGDLSLAETAVVLDRPLGTVKTHYQRALVHLRSSLQSLASGATS